MNANFQTDWSSPPGATIIDALHANDIPLDEFATLLERSRDQIDQLISGGMSIDRELAIQLSDIIGASPTFWLQRQADYDLDRQLVGDDREHGLKQWVAAFPTRDMAKFGWMPTTRSFDEKLANCFEFFGVKSVTEWEDRYSNELQSVAFRSSAKIEADIPATIAWLRKGELEAESRNCQPWNKAKLKQLLPELRELTREKKPAVFVPEMIKRLATCGVALVISRTPSGCRASGATKFVNTHRALMLLSFRHRTDDHFWFTFFHEAAHLLLHDNTRLFIENGDCVMEKEEEEANKFAQDFLIPAEYRSELFEIRRDYRRIARFAKKVGVSAGIVVGQLQFHEYVPRSHFNKMKHHFEWPDVEMVSNL